MATDCSSANPNCYNDESFVKYYFGRVLRNRQTELLKVVRALHPASRLAGLLAGRSRAINIAMTAMTTSSSMSVNPRRVFMGNFRARTVDRGRSAKHAAPGSEYKQGRKNPRRGREGRANWSGSYAAARAPRRGTRINEWPRPFSSFARVVRRSSRPRRGRGAACCPVRERRREPACYRRRER